MQKINDEYFLMHLLIISARTQIPDEGKKNKREGEKEEQGKHAFIYVMRQRLFHLATNN